MATVQITEKVEEARKAVAAGLDAFNARYLPEMHPQSFAVTVTETGEIVGGLVAETMSGWMVINLLWVDERYRRQGFGRRLLKEAEAEAARRDVHSILVDTFSFQAPVFYERNGYRAYGQVEGFPQAGITWIRLRKTL